MEELILPRLHDAVDRDIQELWFSKHTVPEATKQCVHNLFSDLARTQPEAPAICAWDGEMTYGELDKQSTRLASHLVGLGVKPEDIVPLCFEKSMWTIVAMLAVLKAGGAFAPLDPEHPRSRHKEIFKQTKAEVVLTSAQHSTLWGKPDCRVVVVSKSSVSQLPRAAGDMPLHTRASHAAYVIFTSGSTGTPKGVVLEHQAVCTGCLSHGKAFGLSPHARFLQFAAFTFDVSITEIITTLLYGGSVCIPSEGDRRDNLAKAIYDMRVNWAYLTPTVARLLDPHTVPTLKTLILGGEEVSTSDCQRWAGKLEVINAYGPTECCVLCTAYFGVQDFKSGLIGKSIASVSWVVDPENHDKPAPLGSIGELLVEGPILARGYLDDPEKTAAAFINDPVWLVQGGGGYPGRQGRLYKTGDLVYYDPNGNLVYVGRKDSQVKIRGQRVELGEIESVLRSQIAVSDAVVVLQHRNVDEVRLAAFVTVSEDDVLVDEQSRDIAVVQHLNTWQERFDSDTYSSINTIRPETIGRDFIGWTSMYDGTEIDKAEMNEWLDETINTILNGRQPENVLEIGSGTGMILFNLGVSLKTYVGLDPSKTAVDFIEATVKFNPALAGKVRMYTATAADIGLLSRTIYADLIIVNSVVQYFPSQEYLFKVVQELLEIKGVKTLFFGDVRSHALHREFLAARALRIAGKNATKTDILSIMADMEQVELELLIDPAFFTALPSRLPHLVEHVEILPKRMKATNELSCYRYAAVVHVRSDGGQEHQIRRIGHDKWIDFTEHKLERQSILQRLRNLTSSTVVAVSNIPHSKTTFSRCLRDSLDNIREETSDHGDWLLSVERKAQDLGSLSATDLIDLARESSCSVEISWSRQYSQYGGLDAVFHRFQPENGNNTIMFQFPTDHARRQSDQFSSKPLRQQARRRVQIQLDEMLRAQLPSYMIPSRITILDAIPINKNGKRDRRALEQREMTEKNIRGAVRSPTSDAERIMQQLWARVLNIKPETIGMDDSFFRLGGDSITAMQLSASARSLHILLSTRDVFRRKTITELARYVTSSKTLPLARIAEDPVNIPFDLAPIQELYLWIEPTSRASFDQRFFLELRTRVLLESLCAALRTLVQRYLMLRA